MLLLFKLVLLSKLGLFTSEKVDRKIFSQKHNQYTQFCFF
jgi:hypothetical protein